MDRYIGLDAHASSCTLGVLGPSGKRLGSHVVETKAKALIEVLRSIPVKPPCNEFSLAYSKSMKPTASIDCGPHRVPLHPYHLCTVFP